MYYYSLDYLSAFNENTKVVLNKKYFNHCPKELLSYDVKLLNFYDYLQFTLLHRNEKWITPTPHPIPWLKTQLVIFHDAYPFKGFTGLLKQNLIRLSYWVNKYKIGIVNKSLLLPFLNTLGLHHDYIYLPNKVNILDDKSTGGKSKKITDIGFFGTDSSKKNYHSLLDFHRENWRYCIFGSETSYVAKLMQSYSSLEIQLCDSSSVSVLDFLNTIDCVVSLSTEEGFGRLNLLAVQKGVPVILLDSPTTREFYEEFDRSNSGIVIAKDVDEIIKFLSNTSLTGFSLNYEAIHNLNKEFDEGFQQICLWINSE